MNIACFSGGAFTEGVEEYAKVKIYNQRRQPTASSTVNKIGVDVAAEALKDCLKQKRCTMDDLWR